jgi:hypothetical protein
MLQSFGYVEFYFEGVFLMFDIKWSNSLMITNLNNRMQRKCQNKGFYHPFSHIMVRLLYIINYSVVISPG